MFLYHNLCRTVLGNTGMSENGTFVNAFCVLKAKRYSQGVSWMDHKKIHPEIVTLYGSSIFETLTHRVLLIILETHYNPGQTWGKCKANPAYFIMRCFFCRLCSSLLCCLLQSGTQPSREPHVLLGSSYTSGFPRLLLR